MKKFFSAVLVATLLPTFAQAATFTVNSTRDEVDARLNGTCKTASGVCTLRAAIQEANNVAGTDIINIPAGRYNMSYIDNPQTPSYQGFVVTGSVKIIGAGASKTIIDASHHVQRLFTLTGPANLNRYDVALQKMTLTGGSLERIAEQDAVGAAIYAGLNATLSIGNTTIENNINGSGTIVVGNTQQAVNQVGSLSISSSTIQNNTQIEGPAVIVYGHYYNPELHFTNYTLLSSSSVFRHNIGGAIEANIVQITDSHFEDNHSGANDSLDPENFGGQAGAVLASRGTITRSSFVRNSGNGGAVYFNLTDTGSPRTVDVNNSTFSQNRGVAGALMISSPEIYDSPYSASIRYNTFTDNTGLTSGAISAGTDQGGTELYNSSVQLQNNIFWGNDVLHPEEQFDVPGANDIMSWTGEAPNSTHCAFFDSLGGNFFENIAGCDAFAADATDRIGVDPLLNPLANNGGLGLSYLPQVGSPVLNVSICKMDDQRRVARAQGPACDSGSIEVKP